MTKKRIKLAIPVYLANAYSYNKSSSSDYNNLVKLRRRHLESFVGGYLKKKFKNKYCFLLPIALSASMADICEFDTGFSTWAKDDYTWISICKEVWVLTTDGWEDSVGVQNEIRYARSIGKKVRYIFTSKAIGIEGLTCVVSGIKDE